MKLKIYRHLQILSFRVTLISVKSIAKIGKIPNFPTSNFFKLENRELQMNRVGKLAVDVNWREVKETDVVTNYCPILGELIVSTGSSGSRLPEVHIEVRGIVSIDVNPPLSDPTFSTEVTNLARVKYVVQNVSSASPYRASRSSNGLEVIKSPGIRSRSINSN